MLLKKNPFDDIKSTKTIEGVILKGRWLARKQLDTLFLDLEQSIIKSHV